MNLNDVGFFDNVPPPAKRGPKPGQTGRKSKIFTEDKLAELWKNPGKWIILYEGATIDQNSNAAAYARRHPEYSTVCRKLPDNPPEAPLTIFAVYRPNKEEEDN